MRLNKSNMVALAMVAGGGAIFYYITKSITDLSFDALGASFFPKIAALGLMLFGTILFITSTWGKQDQKKETGYTFQESMKILCFLVFLFLYVLCLPTVGFLLATTLLMLIIFLILSDRWTLVHIGGALLFSILCTYVLWYVFTKQFDLILP
jgi:putative tricarboxylic transport membrane protein